MKLVSPGYFETMGTRIIAGRDITWSDIETGGRVAAHLGGVRSRARRPSPRTRSGSAFERPSTATHWREVIGVVQSVKEDALYAEAPSLVYWPAFMENAFGNAGVRRPGRSRSWSAATARARRASSTRSGKRSGR